MSKIIGGMFSFDDRLQMQSLNQRLTRSNVITANIANSETPGFRAIGYDFEEQLQMAADTNEPSGARTSDPRHLRNQFAQADGTMYPDVYVRPTESIPQDGNTVDIDGEMAHLAQNQILYRSTVELINRKVGLLKYAITNGGR
jgi:flagellar basal-body rod protein FlgB